MSHFSAEVIYQWLNAASNQQSRFTLQDYCCHLTSWRHSVLTNNSTAVSQSTPVHRSQLHSSTQLTALRVEHKSDTTHD